MDMKLVTSARRTFDRALAALPITQHDRVWVLYLVSGWCVVLTLRKCLGTFRPCLGACSRSRKQPVLSCAGVTQCLLRCQFTPMLPCHLL
jgi:hypothetical protein